MRLYSEIAYRYLEQQRLSNLYTSLCTETQQIAIKLNNDFLNNIEKPSSKILILGSPTISNILYVKQKCLSSMRIFCCK